MEISFIGAGNLAWHLAQALENAGHHINEVYSRQLQHSRQLVSQLYDAHTFSDLNFAESPSRLFFLTVADHALEDVCSRLVLPENSILVHTAGGQSLTALSQWMTVFSDVRVHTGVLYPLQTFTREQPLLAFETIPICIEASDPATETTLVDLGQDISNTVYLITSAERRTLHIGAVLACNFTNHLLALAHDLTMQEGLEFDLLRPIVSETIRKALSVPNPADVQTGPARRFDQSTIDTHLTTLAYRPGLLDVYQVLTDSIQRYYSPASQS